MSTDARLTTLEHAMAELAVAQARTHENLDRLALEMRSFKEGMGAFKEEMGSFKDEMRSFKDEMKVFKDEMAQASRAADRRLGELSNRMGTLAEDIVAPSVPGLFQRLFAIEKPESTVRAKRRSRRDPGRMREFDVVAWGGTEFLVNETKSQLRPGDVEALVASLPEARDYFLEAEGREIVGSLSAFHADESLVRAAERAGLYVFGLGSGLLEVLNGGDFKPRRF